MGIADKLKSALFEDGGEKKSSPSPPSIKPPRSTTSYTIPTVPHTSGYPTPVSTSGPYAALQETLNQVNHPGMAFFKYLDNLKEEIPDEAQRYRIALKLSGVPKEQIKAALDARKQALQNEVRAVEERYGTKWGTEITVRETRISTLQGQIANLNSQITGLQSQIGSLTTEKDQKASEMQANKQAFDFAAQTVAADLETAENTLSSYLT